MNHQKRDRLLLAHILDSISAIKRYTHGVDKTHFLRDDKTQSAVIRQLEVIGEATSHLSTQLKTQHSRVDWVAISGMRNKLIHEYFGVDLDLVWQVVKKDITILEKEVTNILRQETQVEKTDLLL